MSDFISFIKSKVFIINLGIAILATCLFFWGTSELLSSYTRHGEFITLPNLSNINVNKAENMLKAMNLNCKIIDSSYDEKLAPLTVLNQNPYPGAHVKRGRNIYLYITAAIPPKVMVPDMADKASLRQAKRMLESVGLKMGRIITQADQCSGCVLKQLYHDKPVSPGVMLPEGSAIDLVVGKGQDDIPGDSLR